MTAAWEPLHAVNFGGGTPSATPVAELGLLLDAIEAQFGLADGAEVSLEVNPEDVDAGSLDQWLRIGFNRVSLGVQSFDDDVLQALGRTHTAAEAETATKVALEAGFETVSIDLIYGTPEETNASWGHTVGTATGLGTAHLSAYALTVERGTELSRAVNAGAAAPDADVQADRYERLLDAARDAGLVRYEVSNFARPGHGCRYNLGTWAGGEYEAIGLGAHGHRDGVRYRNVRRLDAYLERVAAGERPRAGSDEPTQGEREAERLMLGLRRVAGVALGAAEPVVADDADVRRLVDAGVAAIEDGRLVVHRPLLTDEVSRAVLGLAEALDDALSGGD